MNQRKLSLVIIGAIVALAAPAWAQTARTATSSLTTGAASSGQTNQDNLALYGTASPVTAGFGTFGSATGSGVGSPYAVTGEATASATGTAPATGSTLDCASTTAVLGLSPAQMPSHCLP
jgi:hypothetical protein